MTARRGTAGAPILTMSVAAHPRLSVPTWGSMPIPLPFSRIAFIYGVPFEVTSGADDETKEKIRHRLEALLYSTPLDRRNSLSLSIKYTQVFRDIRQ